MDEGRSICICFSTSDTRISKAVRWFTQSEVSHCLITYKDPVVGQAMALDVGWSGFRLIPWTEWQADNRLVARYSINVPEERQVRAINRQLRYLGTKYNYFSLIVLMFRRVKKFFYNPFSSSKRLICSEAVALFLNSSGAARIKHPGSWTPQDLFTYVKENKDMFQLVEREF